jgi:hypothetical protein
LALVPATVVAAVALGLPTDVLPNPWFTRMTPVRPLDLVLWPLTSVALGALLATYAVRGGRKAPSRVKAGLGSAALGVFALGCPVCNRLVVLALGVSGALVYFEPLQPLLGTVALVVAVVALRARLRALRATCPVAPRAARVE